MYAISDLLEIGSAEELVMAVKLEDIVDDVTIPSSYPSEQFDE